MSETNFWKRRTLVDTLIDNVSINASESHTSEWLSSKGFSSIGLSIVNDATTNSSLNIEWSYDGINKHGEEQLLTGTGQYKPIAIKGIVAPYFRVVAINGDSLAHTMSVHSMLTA